QRRTAFQTNVIIQLLLSTQPMLFNFRENFPRCDGVGANFRLFSEDCSELRRGEHPDRQTKYGRYRCSWFISNMIFDTDFDSMREHHREEHRSRRVEDSREEQISEMKRGYEEYR
ncbi:unnamed protein product, partial [Brassica oleracea]